MKAFETNTLNIISSNIFFQCTFIRAFSHQNKFPINIFFIKNFPSFHYSIYSFIFIIHSSYI